MDKTVVQLYKEYGEYVNSFRAFPLDIDGLKPVERRVLLTAYLVAKDKLVKSARIDGTCIARFHPHGSVYSTIVQLAIQDLLDYQGNFGSNVGVDPVGAAASRYTEVRLAKKTLELAFKYINYVPWEQNDLNEKEATFLPTMYPLCFLGTEYTQGIGFGYRTMIPCYDIKDLQKRLLWLIGERKTKPTIKPITDCEILAGTNELEELLTTGKAGLEVQGIIVPDPKKSIVSLKSWPPGKRFESILNKFQKSLEIQDIGWVDSSTTETNVIFEVLKQRNRDKLFEKLVKDLKLAVRGNISFETIVIDNKTKKVHLKSIDEILLTTFNMFKDVNKNMLNVEIGKAKTLMNEYEILEKIRPYLGKELATAKIDPQIIIDKISKQAKVEPEVIKQLFSKYSITKLLNLTIDIVGLQNEINQYNDNLKNLQQFVIKQYEQAGV